jgi:hypothetical protein
MRSRKNPWIAAILNFFIWGLGYQYVGSKRVGFRTGLIVAEVLAIIMAVLVGAIEAFAGVETRLTDLLISWPYVITGLAFAWDAYKDALETR